MVVCSSCLPPSCGQRLVLGRGRTMGQCACRWRLRFSKQAAFQGLLLTQAGVLPPFQFTCPARSLWRQALVLPGLLFYNRGSVYMLLKAVDMAGPMLTLQRFAHCSKHRDKVGTCDVLRAVPLANTSLSMLVPFAFSSLSAYCRMSICSL